MTRVKICGITNLEDALMCAEYGADELGFNFYDMSPRFISAGEAGDIISRLPANVRAVGVFVNAPAGLASETAAASGISSIQLHGDEAAAFADETGRLTGLSVIKAFRVGGSFAVSDVLGYRSAAILLDAFSPRERGGTGHTFDWGIARQLNARVAKLYLAGGLSRENVGRAVAEVDPFAVDACSMLERVPGRKDPEKVRDFIRAVKNSSL